MIEKIKVKVILPCIIVPKPNGIYRLITDNRKNALTRTDSIFIPGIDDWTDKSEKQLW